MNRHNHLGLTMGFLLSVSSFSQDRSDHPRIEVIEFDKNGIEKTTHVLQAEYPKKPLVSVDSQGKKRLNIDSKNLQESGVYEVLNANFNFDLACNFLEWQEFKKQHPDKENWEIERLFAQKYIESGVSLPRNSECFAKYLEELLDANPCLKKQGVIQFRSLPITAAITDDPTGVYLENGAPDSRRIVGVAVLGCPFEDAKEDIWKKKHPCGFSRPWSKPGNFFTPGKWYSLVKECSAAYKDPELKKMANAAINRAHTR